MRILYIYDGDWPKGATRVRKETRALADGGHDVLLLCRNETRRPRDQCEPWMKIRRLPAVRGAALNHAFNFPLPLNPVWLHQIRARLRDWRADLIVVEDLPLAPAALLVGRTAGVPVLYDMGEVYPEFLRGLRRFKDVTLADRVVRNPTLASLVERWVLRRADHVFVVSEESRARAVGLGAPAGRVSVVGNTPEDLGALSAPAEPPPELLPLTGRPVVLFVGILISDRGLVEAIEAMEVVRRSTPDAVLVIVGEGPERPRVEQAVRRLDLEHHVVLTGWKDHDALPGFYQHARVGLLPFQDGGQIRFTLANKLFDYMGAGLPVVASDVPPMRRIIEETGAGVLARPGDSAALGDAILQVLDSSEERRRAMAREGRRAVAGRYNWGRDAERMLEAVARHAPSRA